MTTSTDANPRMLRAAAKLRRVFQLPVPDAPGLVFFGGEADPALLDPLLTGLPVGYLAGSGLSPQVAFEACVGEGVEYLSQFRRVDDVVVTAPSAEPWDAKDATAGRFIADVHAQCIEWIATRRLLDDAEAWFPVDFCLRRSSMSQEALPPFKLSTGCAAGATFAKAALRAVLELIERDAVALWWRGGRRGRPIAADGEAARAATELLVRVRQGNDSRHVRLLDITTDVGIPVVAAVSANANGRGCALGYGSRPSLVEAVRAAVFEMCQAELGQHVVAAKRHDGGDAALSDNERRIFRRGTLLDARTCILLQPDGLPAPERPKAPNEPEDALRYAVDRLDRMGISAYLLDLTRADFGIPVVRVLAPGLQLEPCEIVGDRLARVIAETGGGAMHTGGLLLL